MYLEHPVRGGSVLIDAADLALTSLYFWRLDRDGYAIRTINIKENGKHRATTQFLHRYLMEAMPGQFIDHINRIRTDNRRCNLRFCTRAENQQNRRIGNGLGCTMHKCGRWQATIRRQGKSHYLGLFATTEDASAVFRLAAALLDNGRSLPSRRELALMVKEIAA